MKIAPPWRRSPPFRRSPILTRSKSAMAQHTLEPLLTLVVLEGVSTSVPPTPILTPSVPLTTPRFPPSTSGGPLRTVGSGQVYAPLDPVTEATLVTATRISETILTPSNP